MSYQFNDDDIERFFLQAITSSSCEPAGTLSIVIDSEIHRYRVEGDKSSEKSGSYAVYNDGWPGGWAKNWRTGETVTWGFPREALDEEGKAYFTKENYEEARKHSEEARKIREQEEKKTPGKSRSRYVANLFQQEQPT